MNVQKLTDITRGMHHAVSTTSAMLAQQYILMVDQFFDRETDETGETYFKAKMATVDIDDKHQMQLPLVSLVAPKGIALDKMRIEMSVQMTEAEAKKATTHMDNSEAERTSFKVSLSPKSHGESRRRSDVVDIVMEFQATEPPEGIMRIIDQYTHMIQAAPKMPPETKK